MPVLTLAVFLVLLPMASAQPVKDGPPSITIRVTSRLVEISVIARDAKGPVGDLTAGQFRVFDNGQEKKIAFFSVSSVRPPAARIAAPDASVFTNQTELRPDAAGRLTVILIDSFNSEFEQQARARQQLMKYIAEVQPRDRMAICAMGTSIRVLHDFTNSPSELARAVDRYWGSLELIPEGKNPASGVLSGAAAFNAGTDAATEEMMRSYRGTVTADLMKQLSVQLARVPGRKSLIWLSAGFPIQLSVAGSKQEYLSVGDLTSTAVALSKSNISIYPVDIAGLTTGGRAGAFANADAGGGNRHAAMDIIADLTGGRAFYDRNDLQLAVREAVDDSEITYNLGFYPDAAGEDGQYHRVQVEADRPGVVLRYRHSYIASLPHIQTGEADGREQIRNALSSPVNATGISISARLEAPNRSKPKSLRMTIAIPLQDISLDESEGRRLDTLDLVVGQRSAEGRDVNTFGEEIRLNPNRQRYDALRKDGLVLRREISLRDEASVVRIVVFDRGSGRLESLEIPVRR